MPITEGGRFSPVDRIVSPGVFTRENDLSGIAQGIANIGAAIVAPFPKGPGFSPVLVESSADLEEKFGVADGVYYGPYTAKEYLLEKGFVTVCRVGALTGYHQKYPFVIYAIKGQWVRENDAGWVTGSSVLAIDQAESLIWNSIGEASVDSENSTQEGTLQIVNAPIYVQFASNSGTATVGGSRADGSTFYYGQTVYLGNTTIEIPISASLSIPVGPDSQSLINALLDNGLDGEGSTYSSLVDPLSWPNVGGNTPFDSAGITFTNVTMSVSGECSDFIYKLEGFVSGAFGEYNGTFTPSGTPTFDECLGTWTEDSADYRILAVLADTQNATINTNLEAPGFLGSTINTASLTTTQIPVDYNLVLRQTGITVPYGVYNFSLDPSSTKYITSVFGTNPTAGNPDNYVAGTKKEAAYLYKIYENTIKSVISESSNWKVTGSWVPNSIFTGEAMEFKDEYSLNLNEGDSEFALTSAQTPWVISQEISPWNDGDPTRFNLFKLHTLSDGTNSNTSYKIEISNVKLAGTVAGSDWGTFTLTVRRYDDSDKRPAILESFPNLSLDPDSSNFIARRIGDRYNYINFHGKILEFGTYSNNSKYIRVEMTNIPYPTISVPYGFREYVTPINSGIGYWTTPMKYTKASMYATSPGKYPSGVAFNDAPTGADNDLRGLYPTSSVGVGVASDNKQYFAPLPSFGSWISVGRNSIFALDSNYTVGGVTGSAQYNGNIIPAEYNPVTETTNVKMRKFIFGFQGGFDGQSPAIPINVGADISPGNTQGLNCVDINSAGSIAYKQCIAALGNSDEFDINMIITPGVIHQHHPYVTNLTVDMCEARGDCFYIMDLYIDDGNPTAGQIPEVIRLADEFDTSYAAAYYPWVKIKDTNTNKIITVPPSVVLPGVYASNDRIAGEWWAVAGLNRGGIKQAIMVTDRTTHTERDSLYEGRVNPIAAFPGQEICVWGQKTLQLKQSALDRIGVRRLLIEIKKFFASTAKYLVFEQNTAATRNRFLSIVNPYLQSIVQRSGLYAFEVVMDETNNTADLIDRNILYGQIFLKPTRTAEFIVFDFNILPTGAAFGSGT